VAASLRTPDLDQVGLLVLTSWSAATVCTRKTKLRSAVPEERLTRRQVEDKGCKTMPRASGRLPVRGHQTARAPCGAL
jgi:hypothetical protein